MQPIPILPPARADGGAVASQAEPIDASVASEIESVLDESTDADGLVVNSFVTVLDEALSLPTSPTAANPPTEADVEAATVVAPTVVAPSVVAPSVVASSVDPSEVPALTSTSQDVLPIVSPPTESTMLGSPATDTPVSVIQQPELVLNPSDSPLDNVVASTDVARVDVETNVPPATSDLESPPSQFPAPVTVLQRRQSTVQAASEATEPPTGEPINKTELGTSDDFALPAEQQGSPDEIARTPSVVKETVALTAFSRQQATVPNDADSVETITTASKPTTNDSLDPPISLVSQLDNLQIVSGAEKPAAAAPITSTTATNIVTSAMLETISKNESRVEVQLDPPELGTVWIELRASDEGLAARIVSEHESTSQLLQDQLATLRKSLTDSGISVDEFSFDTANGNASEREHPFADGDEYAKKQLAGYSLRTETPSSSQDVALAEKRVSNGINVVA